MNNPLGRMVGTLPAGHPGAEEGMPTELMNGFGPTGQAVGMNAGIDMNQMSIAEEQAQQLLIQQ